MLQGLTLTLYCPENIYWKTSIDEESMARDFMRFLLTLCHAHYIHWKTVIGKDSMTISEFEVTVCKKVKKIPL